MIRPSRVYLDRFTRFKAPWQAEMAQPLVHANPWLKDSHYADAAARYGQGYLRAVRHIGRISHSRHDDAQLHPFLICTEKRIGVVPPRTAIGIGTIITRQLLEVPNATPGGNFLALKGNDLDYWVDAEMGEVPGLHREVANALLVRSLSLAAKERGALNNFATLQQHRSHLFPPAIDACCGEGLFRA